MRSLIAPALLALAIFGCQNPGNQPTNVVATGPVELQEIARSDRQWTGVTVSRNGRIFVNYPRWSDNVPVSVAELKRNGQEFVEVAYPNTELQQWTPGKDGRAQFVCVQSVVADSADGLWIVDAASPKMAGVVPGAAKLMKVDLKTNRIVKTYPIDAPVIDPKSYLNDIRIDNQRDVAYLTDSGAGGLIVVDLASGKARKVLANHPSTKSEGASPVIDGKEWRRPDGSKPEIHADGIALSPDGKFLYYHALTGKTLYRIETRHVRNEALTEKQLGKHVQMLGATGQCDGMEMGPGGTIYLTQLEQNAVTRWLPRSTHAGRPETIVQSPLLAWPDTLATGPDGALYVTTSQIHLQPNPPGPYRLFKIAPRRAK